jgi:hypothetical protein
MCMAVHTYIHALLPEHNYDITGMKWYIGLRKAFSHEETWWLITYTTTRFRISLQYRSYFWKFTAILLSCKQCSTGLHNSLNSLHGHPGTHQWFICHNIPLWWLSDLAMLIAGRYEFMPARKHLYVHESPYQLSQWVFHSNLYECPTDPTNTNC